MSKNTPTSRQEHLPFLPLAGISTLLLLVLGAGSGLGFGSSPYGSTEILVVPALAALFMFPAYAAARWVPIGVIALLKAGASQPWLVRLGSVVIATGLLVTVWIAFGEAIRSQWGIVDDHEIMRFLGSDGMLGWREIPELLMKTEVGLWGAHPRYRPTYYFLRLVETAVWGKNPALWYACRVALVGLATVVSWRLLWRSLGRLGAALLCMYTLTFPYWNEFVGRLGPSETYIVIGLPIYLAGFVAAIRASVERPMVRVLAGGAILAGSVVCIGSKENLLLLVLPSAYLFVRAARRKDYWLLVAAAGSLLFAAHVAGGLLLSFSMREVDIYDRSVSLGPRLAEIIAVLRSRHFLTPFSMLVAVTVSVGGLSLLPRWNGQQRNGLRWAGFWLACLCLVFASQMVFYTANWPVTVMRYGYPGLLYYPASILILYCLARDLLAGYTAEMAAQLALKASLIASLVVVIVYHEGYAGSIRAMRANVAETGEFTTRLERLAARLREDETVQLVLESSGIRDWEAAVQGYPRFLAAYQVHNPLFLRMSGYGAASFSPGLDQRLAAELEAISMNGNGDYLPLASLEERPGQCLSFYLSSEYPTGCEPFR